MNTLATLLSAFWQLWLDAAPWLILGLVVAGLMQALISTERLAAHLGGEGIWPVIKAALLGAPLPLCSCGVIPAAVGLRRAGASRGATSSFLISTPETGVDSIAISYALLGPFLAVMRPLAALVTAIIAGVLTGFTREPRSPRTATSRTPQAYACCPALASKADASVRTATDTSSGCSSSRAVEGASAPDRDCGSAALSATPPVAPSTASSCCGTSAPSCSAAPVTNCCASSPIDASPTSTAALAPGGSSPLTQRLIAGQKMAFTDLFGDLVNWLLVGLLFAALVVAFVPQDFLARFSDGLPAMLVMAAIGVPMYICASASTPVAAGLLLAGVSPGAVLVFMLAGPATNIATLGIVRRELGNAALIVYLASVVGVGIAFGYLTNALIGSWELDIHSELAASAEILPHWLSMGAALALAILSGAWYFQQWQGRRQGQANCCG
ncbi:SO_0444 family Cu/Zn efflux transporter [Halomonas shantousis]